MNRNDANIVLAAILETCAAMPDGAPSGPMWMGMYNRVTLDEYQALIGMLKETGQITESNHCFFITEKGLETVRNIAEHRDRAARNVQHR